MGQWDNFMGQHNAVLFSGDNGTILEIQQCPDNYMQYFNCSLLSSFSYEDERLFIGGSDFFSYRHGLVSLRSIRGIKKKTNYLYYIECLSIIDSILNGQSIKKERYSKSISF